MTNLISAAEDSFVKSKLRDYNFDHKNRTLNLLIDLGLILQAFGDIDKENNVYYFNKDEALLIVQEALNNNVYYVFRTTENITNREKLLHIIVKSDHIIVDKFKRGTWEKLVKTIAIKARDEHGKTKSTGTDTGD